MSFFDPDNLRAVTSGRWIQRPDAHSATTGIGTDSREDLTGRAFIAIRGETHDGHAYLRAASEAGATLAIVDRAASEAGATLAIVDRAATEAGATLASVDRAASEAGATLASVDRAATSGPVPGAQFPPGLGVLAVEDTRRALAQLAVGHRRSLPATKVIAITGSCGKTTTKRLVHAVLAADLAGTAAPKSYNNDIGVPLTLLGIRPRDKYVVVEIGTNAPGEITQLARLAEPDIAVITSVGRSHLAGFGSVDAIAKEKSSLLAHLAPAGLAVLNADDGPPASLTRGVASSLRYGESIDADLRLTDRGRGEDGRWWFEVNGRIRFDLALPGKHNAINALAAVAIGRRFGIDDEQTSWALGHVEPEPMRMALERIPVGGGVLDLYNDAYNANPESMIAALETFVEVAATAPRRFVVLGDMLELGDEGPTLHGEIGRHLIDVDCRCPIEHFVFVGPLAEFMSREVRRIHPASRCTVAGELDHLVIESIQNRLRPGDAVLVKASRGLGLERLAVALREDAALTPSTSP